MNTITCPECYRAIEGDELNYFNSDASIGLCLRCEKIISEKW
jgi:NAD-dependent SIR2 family protein deacetylase